MKTALIAMVLGVGLGVATTALAQDDKKTTHNNDKVTIRVRVSEEKDGKTETIERKYTYQNLSEAERETKLKAIIDSLRGDKDVSNRRLSVTIEEGDEILSDKSRWGDDMATTPRNRENRTRIYEYDRDHNRNNSPRYFHFDNDAFTDRMKRIEKDIQPRMRKLELDLENFGRDFEPRFREFWNNDINIGGNAKPSSIRGLEAFSNNPDKDQLNVRFYAPAKGDVTILVTNTKGQQVAKKEIKDFEGDFVGQIELGKDPKGTYFLSVTQNEDGAVKRVVIE
jgi:hypothetical protein